MNYSEWLSDCKVVCIYLGNTCNFDCSYCDRGYISNVIGGQNLSHSDLKHIENFFNKIFSVDNVIDRITFHGGEPFLFVKRMDQVLTILEPILQKHNIKVVITTNASLILENKSFIEKWGKYLQITISYDFIFQEENRDYVDIDSVGQLLLDNNIPIMWQFVMPITDPRIFSLDIVKDIVDKVKYCKERFVNLIPLRHHRGENKFKDFFEEVDMYNFSEELIRLITTLYNYNISVIIDGNYDKIDKNYLGKHYKIILSPDGYIYPEYDFCEYKVKETILGSWKGLIPVFNEHDKSRENQLILDSCNSCEVKEECGIKYLYKLFDKQPNGKCKTFYKVINNAVKYNNDLKKKPTVWHWVNNMENQCLEVCFEDVTDYKQYFIQNDNVYPVKQELVFSLFRRYNCYAGCHVCYVDKYFEKDKSKFSRFIPDSIPKELEDSWFKLFEVYNCVTVNDELYYLKQNHPVLFDWYVKNADKFYFGAVTDNAFVRNYDIFMNDIHLSKGMYEVSFSEDWIEKITFDKIGTQLDNLHGKYKITQIKFIEKTKDSFLKGQSKKLKDWCDLNNVIFAIHHDFLKNDTVIFSKEYQRLHFGSFNQELYTVCGEADYLQYDSFFLTLVDAINPTIKPYDVIDEEFSIERHIVNHLHGKKELYQRYYNGIKFSDNSYNKKLTEYFKYIIDNLQVNDDYNFIPNVCINDQDRMYWWLSNRGWTPTELGLVNMNNLKNVTPLFKIK